MKITKRQLRKIIKEELTPDTLAVEAQLRQVWDMVRADVMAALGGRASWEDIADEVLAAAPSHLVDEINLLPFDQQDILFQKIFKRGVRY